MKPKAKASRERISSAEKVFDMLRSECENNDEVKIVNIFQEAFLLRRRKGRDYGNSWRHLGSKKEFVYLYDKTQRLKNLLWENREPANEKTRDTLVDLINYAFHTLILLEEETGGK